MTEKLFTGTLNHNQNKKKAIELSSCETGKLVAVWQCQPGDACMHYLIRSVWASAHSDRGFLMYVYKNSDF